MFVEFLKTLDEAVVQKSLGDSFSGFFGIVEPGNDVEGVGGEFEKTGGGAFGVFKGLLTGP